MKKILIFIRLLLSPFCKSKENAPLFYHKSGQIASDYIKELLLSDRPVMICRFGSTELDCIVDYKNRFTVRNAFKFMTHKINSLGYNKSSIYSMLNNSGFFPNTPQYMDQFSEMMIYLMPLVDVLGSWRFEERLFDKELSNAIKVPLGDLEPYFHQNPWSEVLKNKKVLVIHPFEDSILSQYQKRDFLFKDERVLPDFELITIKAVQSLGAKASEFETWFNALEYMKCKIDKHDFDIAIIGCGAYGFPLAAYVKSIGKKAVHLGGATQMLFGIKSKSWEDEPKFHYLMNENWVRPKETERPANYKLVEGGRYW
ncbi:MAG: hypothetical protein QM751_12705 [Paludibacteraceae bacterium]